jgi:tRNA dimethylallyltransferase
MNVPPGSVDDAAGSVGGSDDTSRQDRRPPAILLMGATASGKTDLALDLAGVFPLGLVSADSALVYRGFDIGAAKPDPATLAAYPHALVDVREPDQPFSAGEFRREALGAMASITATGRVPLLVGGTGLYFRALTRGLAQAPQADPALRARIEARAGERGWAALHTELAAIDPAAAARIRPTDPQRIQRALEVWHLTGRPLSELQRDGATRPPYRFLKLILLPGDRAGLHARIERRFDAMLDAGFLDEVRRLRARGDLHPDLPSVRAVGYRQAWRHLDGDTDAASFRREAIEATRQLAKRQYTWFRSERDGFLLPDRPAEASTAARARIGAFLDLPPR